MPEKRTILHLGAAATLVGLLKLTRAPTTTPTTKKATIPTEKNSEPKIPRWEDENPALPWWSS